MGQILCVFKIGFFRLSYISACLQEVRDPTMAGIMRCQNTLDKFFNV